MKKVLFSKRRRRQPEGDHTQVLSRRRSLSALAKVRERVVTMQLVALSDWNNLRGTDAYFSTVRAEERKLALDSVLRVIAEVAREEPKGNGAPAERLAPLGGRAAPAGGSL
jgi:hypothetical protein